MTKYPGVYFHTRAQKWMAHLSYNSMTVWLGTYADELTAMKVRDFAIRELGTTHKRYFADHELGPEIERMYRDAISRRQGQQVEKTRRSTKRKVSKYSKLRRKMLDIQKMAENAKTEGHR